MEITKRFGLPLMLIGWSLLFGAMVLVIVVPKASILGSYFVVQAAAGVCIISGATIRRFDLRRTAKRLAKRNYSWCAACGYAFNTETPDENRASCSECGTEFTARDARTTNRAEPLRLHFEDA